VFRSNYNGIEQAPVKPLAEDNAFQIIERIVKRAKVEHVKVGNRYDKALNTGFRKRFNTIMKTTEGEQSVESNFEVIRSGLAKENYFTINNLQKKTG